MSTGAAAVLVEKGIKARRLVVLVVLLQRHAGMFHTR